MFRGSVNDRFRRHSPVAVPSGEGLLTQRKAVAQAGRLELLNLPQSRPSCLASDGRVEREAPSGFACRVPDDLVIPYGSVEAALVKSSGQTPHAR